MRKLLQRTRRIEVKDLSEWERYFGEWLTVRQVAWLLHCTMQNVYHMRDSGRLSGRKLPTILNQKEQWHFLKTDVKALMRDPDYLRNRALYKRYRTPEGKASLQEADLEKQRAVVRKLVREQTARNHLQDWQDSYWYQGPPES